jgi:hypothetical protein
MGQAGGIRIYTGPIPSPARRWAPWVVVSGLVILVGNAAQFVLNVMERGYQQDREHGVPPSVATVKDTLDQLHRIGGYTTIAVVVFLVLAVIWSRQRSSHARIAQYGVDGVEQSLRSVQPVVNIAFWVALAVSLLATFAASSTAHTSMTVHDYVTYRTYLAVSNAARVLMWWCWITLVLLATRRQDDREREAQQARAYPAGEPDAART